MRRKEEDPCAHTKTERKRVREEEKEEGREKERERERRIAIFRAKSSYQEKQQVKGFRPAFFYRRRIFLGDWQAHVASLRDFASLDSLLFVGRATGTMKRETSARPSSGHDGISDINLQNEFILQRRIRDAMVIKINRRHSLCRRTSCT